MTRKEAEAILAMIARGEVDLERIDEFPGKLWGRGYTAQDIRPVIRSGRLEGAPDWDERHGEHRVRVLGRSLESRLTRLVLGLRPGGPHTLISIHEVRPTRPRRPWRERKRK